MQTTKRTAWAFLWYALYAFAGLGLEFLLLGRDLRWAYAATALAFLV